MDHHILIVGTGSIGERHTRCFLATGRTKVSICESLDDQRKAVADSYDLSGSYSSLDDAVAAAKFGAAIVAIPAHLHIPIASRILEEAGCHLLIEKPLSISLDGVEQLRSAALDRGLTVAMGYNYRAISALADMREAIQGGRFGDPVQIVAVIGQHLPTYRPAYREIYYTDRATGGGSIQDGLTHIINAAEWLVGSVTRVSADAAHQVLEGVKVEDTVHVIARHGNVMGSYSLNQHQAPTEVSITVVCERGTARFETHHTRWRWMETPGGKWTDVPHPTGNRDTMYLAQADRFLDVLEDKASPACTLDEGIQTLKVNLAILQSADNDCEMVRLENP